MAGRADVRAAFSGPSGIFWRVATAAGVIASALTIIWAATPASYFWPGWVWLSLAIPLAYWRTIRWGLRTKGRRSVAVHLAVSSVTALSLVWIWAMSTARFFWPVFPVAVLGVALALHLLAAPSRRGARERELEERVEDLATSCSRVLESQAAELRRVERDLHDGAQAQLVSLGMSLGMAEELFESDPYQARRLLADAQISARTALAELRDLVRGIQPPVLVDRGLDEAIRACSLTIPLPVEMTWELPSVRFPAPVESAVYFAVSEALANVVKHSDATGAWVRGSHDGKRLSVEVGDNGRGGAIPEAGGGLAGIQGRLAAFDGRVEVSSPAGGPTVVLMEVPCELSSSKISRS